MNMGGGAPGNGECQPKGEPQGTGSANLREGGAPGNGECQPKGESQGTGSANLREGGAPGNGECQPKGESQGIQGKGRVCVCWGGGCLIIFEGVCVCVCVCVCVGGGWMWTADKQTNGQAQ